MSDTAPYRAVSPWAVGGLGVAVVYAAWMLVVAFVAYHSQLPLLFSPATLLLPVTAMVFSVSGWVQIRRSEGTRVGLRLAQGGLFVGTLAGSLCAAHWLSTELALRQQAKSFTLQWLEQVKSSPTDPVASYAAFWNTLDPLRRDRSLDLNSAETRQKLANDPAAFAAFRDELHSRYFWKGQGQKGSLPHFFDYELIQRVRQGGERVEVESLGVRTWEFLGGQEGGYLLEQTYRLTTPEGVFETTVPVLGRDRERRQWCVQIGDAGIRQTQLSAFGAQMRELRLDSRRFAADWARKLAEGKGDEAFLDTLPLEERIKLRGHPAKEIHSQSGWAAFAAGELANVRKLIPDEPRKLEEMVKEVKALFGGKGVTLHVVMAASFPASPWQLEAKEVRFFQPCELIADKYRLEGWVVVATSDATLLQKLREAEQLGPRSPEGPRLGRQASWRIVSLELETGSGGMSGRE